ncbi:MAG: PEGA domain-containing protein [Candidatus Daviesbacteria bacterium]|nr:PEGA domain-containing protein [Candidatus Daviesbacteria bacterium]
MKKFLVWFLILLSLIALLLRFSNQLAETFFGVKQTSGISILSDPIEATVFLDGKETGKTPFDSKDLDVKEYLVRLEKNKAFWQGKVKLNAGTIVVIIRDIASDSASSAGEILTLDRGKGITIISNPSDAGVEIDGRIIGKTPITADVNTGEHTILVSHTNYLNRSIKVDLPVNFNLTVSVDLALSEADLEAIETPVITQTPEVIVKQTPTGFLRVRDKASLSGKEIAQVKPGDNLILLEEQGSWDRIRLSNGTEGFVSSSYVEKKSP